METTAFYALFFVINSLFVVSSCQNEGKASLASFHKLFLGIFLEKHMPVNVAIASCVYQLKVKSTIR